MFGGGGVGPAGGRPPDQDAGLRLLHPPPLGLLAPMVVTAERLLSVIITHVTIGDAIRLTEQGRQPDGVTRTLVRCLIYVRISMDDGGR